jgi:hypothetical protein
MFKTQHAGLFCWDVHTHMARQNRKAGGKNVFTQWVDELRPAIMKDCGIDAAGFTDLDAGWLDAGWRANAEKGAAEVAKYGAGRILAVLGDYRPGKGLETVQPGQIAGMKKEGYCGYKWHWNAKFNSPAKYCLLSDPHFRPYYEAMQAAGMPLWSLHLEAPCKDRDAQDAALEWLLGTYPRLTVMRAHLGHNRRLTLAQLASMFDRFPNYNYDTSASWQHFACWTDRDEFRAFVIKYSDRLVFGTDAMGDHKTGVLPVKRLVKKYAGQFEYLETENTIEVARADFGCTNRPERYTIKGLGLPRPVLEKIYWRNAVRLFPEVRAALTKLGYDIGVVKPEPGDRKTPRAARLLRLTKPGVVTPEDLASYTSGEAASVKANIEALVARLKP